MRTRLRFGEDGTVRQVVSGSGDAVLEVVDAADDEDPAAVADAIRARYTSTLFDYVSEWPVRMAVVRHRGVPTHAVRTFCHLVADGMGFAVLIAELTGERVVGAAMDPLEQARWQRGPAGRRQDDSALRYWEGLLRAVPARRFSGAAQPRDPASWQVSFKSPAMHLAAQTVAARNGVGLSPVLLAAFAVALARVTGNNPVVTRVMVSNRFRLRLADSMSPVSQPGLCVLDVAGVGFDEAVAQAVQATVGAYKYAYYDPEHLRELVTRLSRERGEAIDIACLFNDRRVPNRPEDADPGSAPTPQRVRDAVPLAALSWRDPVPGLNERLMININDTPDTVDIWALVDTRHVSPADLEALLYGMQDATVEAALDPAARASDVVDAADAQAPVLGA
jgi:hypothetical protein